MKRAFKDFNILSLILIGVGFILGSCSLSAPPAPPLSKSPPVGFLKVVAYSEKDALKGYFTMMDAATNQVTGTGELKIHLFTSTRVSMDSGTSIQDSGMVLNNTLFNSTVSLGPTNFHWESFGSMFQVKDLTFRFVIPYNQLKIPVTRGTVVSLKLEFKPDVGPGVFSSTRKVSLY